MNENRWEQAGAAAGIMFVALILASIFVVPSPPHINASFLNIANYYVSNRGGLITSALLGVFGSLFFLWFVAHLRHVLQRAEGGSEALSPIVFISGTAVAVLGVLSAIPQATLAFGSHRIQLITNAGVVRSLFYMGNVMFALLTLTIALFLAAASVAMVRKELVMPPVGYAGLLFAVAALFGGISAFYVTNYSAWWLGLQTGALLAALAWVLVASVMMIARPEVERAEAPEPVFASSP
jgi:hypothetical protein